MSLTRARAVVLVVALGALALAAAGPAWVRAETTTALDPHVAVAVSGGDAAPAVNAAGLVLVAAGLALALGGRLARAIVLAVVAAAGVLVAWSAVAVAVSPQEAATAGAVAVAGVTDLTAPASVTAWPWLCAAVGALAVAAAAGVGVAARRWPSSSARHERTGASAPGRADAPEAAAAADAQVDPHDAWDTLTRGADPTAPADR
ncbi:Trp biosynthesis-associated membrane protein [Xylanimonas ulmi]|uniref:Putative membrane protein (TIGR02234 family) n=1 Tax=Xylanimonas ulmi TaxID=228973 RepID=A0A4Q7LZ12_9MICO|nr:Trp biosynthesis-associated membrane protein [Xylanibacterium ulmi]RZS60575.1 putative membrane protein (TIGR02234 family) [Xylanibacterium ulmi]